MNNWFRQYAVAWVALMLFAGAAFAQGRIATVDLAKAYNSYWKKQNAEALLKDQQADMEKELKSMQDQYKKINEDYQKLLDSASDPAISTEERDKRKSQADDKLKQLKQKQEDYGSFKNRAEVDLSERRKTAITRIVSEIRSIVAVRAKSANYSLVLDSGGGESTSPVLYSSPENDITADVIKDLNATAPATGGSADGTESDKKSGKKKGQ